MKIPRLFPKKKLQAVTATRRAEPECASEPNIKLSSAVVIVLVLHLVAIGGIYLFSSLNNKPDAKESAPEKKSDDGQRQNFATQTSASGKTYRVKGGDTLAKIAAAHAVTVNELEEANDLKNVGALRVGQEIKIPAKPATKPVSTDSRKISETKSSTGATKDSGENYTVTKGDNLALIAKKLRVSQDELSKLNKIDDPKKLQIGQRLRVPAKHKNDVATTAP